MPKESDIKKAIRNPLRGGFFLLTELYNLFVSIPVKRRFFPSGFRELDEIRQRALKRSGISDHLEVIFIESLIFNPDLIVELGVRGGESTFVFERVARLCDAKLISVDINDCSKASSYENWTFVKSDDVEFARAFPRWCEDRGIDPSIDILFIDTSHLFEHTLSEIEHWFPYLSKKAKVFFHDTNLRTIFFRKDGSMGLGWNNKRGVIRALECFFNRRFNERANFTDLVNGWLIRHYANCSGLTILEKLNPEGTNPLSPHP